MTVRLIFGVSEAIEWVFNVDLRQFRRQSLGGDARVRQNTHSHARTIAVGTLSKPPGAGERGLMRRASFACHLSESRLARLRTTFVLIALRKVPGVCYHVQWPSLPFLINSADVFSKNADGSHEGSIAQA